MFIVSVNVTWLEGQTGVLKLNNNIVWSYRDVIVVTNTAARGTNKA